MSLYLDFITSSYRNKTNDVISPQIFTNDKIKLSQNDNNFILKKCYYAHTVKRIEKLIGMIFSIKVSLFHQFSSSDTVLLLPVSQTVFEITISIQ